MHDGKEFGAMNAISLIVAVFIDRDTQCKVEPRLTASHATYANVTNDFYAANHLRSTETVTAYLHLRILKTKKQFQSVFKGFVDIQSVHIDFSHTRWHFKKFVA